MLSILGTIVSDGSLFGNLPFVTLVGLSAAIAGTAVMGILGSKRPPRFPPGPTPVPFLGNLSDIRKEGQPLWVTMGDLAKEYGDIFSVKLGDKWYVVLNTYEAIKEGMLTNPEALSDRAHYYSTDIFSDDYRDLAYTNNSPTLLLHHEFALGTFRDVSSTAHLDSIVDQQFKRYVEPLLASAEADMSVDGIALGQIMAVGLMVTWCFGPDSNDELRHNLTKVVSEDVSLNLVGRRIPVDIFPILKYVPLSSNRVMRDVVDRFMTILRNEFHRRRKVSDDEEDDVADLCGALLRAQRSAEKEDKFDFLTDVHVIQVLASSFRGCIGFLTTTYWELTVMVEYPDVQEKVANEILDVIGSDRQPSLADRDAMPYTVACVMELLRFGSVAPLGVPRAAHTDVTINDFDIPKDTIILYNIYGTHFNEANFDNPEEFNPGRFLNGDGSLIPNPNKLIPFGLGFRKCLGYVQAKSFLFLNLCHLLRSYRLSKLEGIPGDRSLLVQDPQYEGSRWPAPFRIGVDKRE